MSLQRYMLCRGAQRRVRIIWDSLDEFLKEHKHLDRNRFIGTDVLP